ncbi:aminotransferase, class V [Aeromicrobium marinum DSM 15272]|uniref:Aminotransferase, class V n=1 Tax=Aeromicrobium marinum DSM 15272 TaxID=585531 RepID=E2SCW5_9ACTN|nr:cysteine desulfurase family protein [Aeromicrobium marinum]EFQ83068.1 aminotransferase, class V [Aeromicrobium marinum DSM 15272]
MIYLDAAATSPVRREVIEAMWPHLTGDFGNPSSHHEVGESARRALDAARADVARFLGCRPGEVVFTGGGTEADNAAVKGITAASTRGRHVVVSAVEHPAVLESAHHVARTGGALTVLPVDGAGRVDPADLEQALRDETALVSIQHANNEVGTVQPVADLAAVAAARGVPFHTDAVQTAGWLDLDVGALGVQALSLSGHKLGAPKGIGVLYLARRTPFEPLLHGGGQESERRSGTENVAGAVGLAAAVRLLDVDTASVVRRRDAFIERVLAEVPVARLTGHPTERLPGSASFVFPGRSGESILLDLERRGIVCSSGSACAAGSDEPSHVLIAMGLEPEVAQTAVRFSFGPHVTDDQLAEAVDALVASVA